MKIKLIIYSNLKNYVENYKDDDGIVKDISEQKTIRQFLEETIKHEKAMDAISMIIVNEKVVPFSQLDRKLQDGDVIKVYPPIGGG
jgi:molybdopterin converting factor small subunit